MTTSQAHLLPHLAATLRERREGAGLTGRAMEEFGRERTSYWRFEQFAHDQESQKYWPNLDEYVTAYAQALGCTELELWEETFGRMKAATKRRPRRKPH